MPQSKPVNIPNNDCIHPIRISTPFLVGDVFSYLIKDEKIVLVDCGHFSDKTEILLKNEFKRHNISLADIDEIWLTHGHPDHFGLARKLRYISGAKIFGHPKEQNNFGNNRDAGLFKEFFGKNGVPEKLNNMMQEQLQWLQKWQLWLTPDVWLDESTLLTSGSMTFYVKHLPGHAPGHVAFYSDNLIFGGDVLIDHISTNAVINFDPDTRRRNKSLLQQRSSLQWMVHQKKHTVLPGHGKIINNPEAVATKHLDEQAERYEEVTCFLENAPAPLPLFEVTKALMPQINQPEQVYLTLSEVMGYLDWASSNGKAEAIEKGNLIYFMGNC